MSSQTDIFNSLQASSYPRPYLVYSRQTTLTGSQPTSFSGVRSSTAPHRGIFFVIPSSLLHCYYSLHSGKVATMGTRVRTLAVIERRVLQTPTHKVIPTPREKPVLFSYTRRMRLRVALTRLSMNCTANYSKYKISTCELL